MNDTTLSLVKRLCRCRFIKVLTSTGRWEYMRVLERSPWHLLVEDARGQRFVTARPALKRGKR